MTKADTSFLRVPSLWHWGEINSEEARASVEGVRKVACPLFLSVWQGRFKSFPIQQDGHLLTAIRYVLRNPVRAGLVEHAMDWPWSSLRFPHLRDPIPIDTPSEWLQWIDQPLFDHELTTLRTCVNRQQPFGAEAWQATIAAALGLESTLRRRGRPSKVSEK